MEISENHREETTKIMVLENGLKTEWPWANEVDSVIYLTEKLWPKITIITPSYNQGLYLEETILSVLNQNYPNLEYIIIDGGSTDNSVEIIKKYEYRITHWESERDKGQTHAINKGIKMGTGDIYAYLNSDDLFDKNALYTVANHFKQEKIDFLTGKTTIIPTGEILDPRHFCFDINIQLNGYCLSLPQQSTFWLSPATGKVFFNEDFQYVFDRLFFLEAVVNDNKFKVIEANLAFFRYHDSSKTIAEATKFEEENFEANKILISKLGNSKSREALLLRRQHFLYNRIQFHYNSVYSLKGILLLFKLIRLNPSYILKREILGKFLKDLKKP